MRPRPYSVGQFQPCCSDYSRSFGNFSVQFDSPDILLRVIRERSQFFIDFASPAQPLEWIDQDAVLNLLGTGAASDALGSAEHRSMRLFSRENSTATISQADLITSGRSCSGIARRFRASRESNVRRVLISWNRPRG
jgi:hypothetical protein